MRFQGVSIGKIEWSDAMYQDIERNGYRRSDSIENNVEVALAANGDLLLIDGRHRLILAQLLDLKKIPVVVNLLAEGVARQDPCLIVRIIQPLVPTKKAKEPMQHSGCLVITILWLWRNCLVSRTTLAPSIISMRLGQRCR